MNKGKRLIFNTLILTLMSFFMRTVGVSFNVYLGNKIGPAGLGLFQLIMTVYSLTITVGAAGIRLASTRLVVENIGLGHRDSKQIMRRCIVYALFTGCLAAVFLFFGARAASTYWLKDIRALNSLRILSISLPFIAMSAALNGYFTATREIPKYAFVQLFEQGVRILSVVISLSVIKDLSIEKACIALVFGSTLSEIVSFSLSYSLYLRQTKEVKASKIKQGNIIKKLVRIALPDAVGTTARSILLTVEHMLIPQGFRKSGSSKEQSLSIYGTIHGMVLPLILYPSAILSSLSGLLVPEVAEQNAKSNKLKINDISMQVIHFALVFGLGTAGVLYFFADNLSLAVYKNLEPAHFIRVLAPLVPIMYLDMTVDGLLKGLDQQLYSMRVNIYDSALCVVLVYTLLPAFAVKGYIFTLFISEVLNFYLSLNRLIKVTQVKINWDLSLVKPIISILASVLSVKAFFFTIISQASPIIGLIFIIVSCVTFYFLYLYLFGCITTKDIRQIQKLIA